MSIAGFSDDEYVELAEMARTSGVHAIEVNCGCPNVWHDGRQERIVSFDPESLYNRIRCVVPAAGSVSVSVKLSPYSDPYLRREVGAMLTEFRGAVHAVVLVNTFPNAFMLQENGQPWISFGKGFGGMGGPAMKAIGLGHVLEFREMLPAEMAIIGVGGITSGQDALDYIRAGASAVQVATACIAEGPRVFSRILGEYVDLVEKAQS